jgi:hypothetical protein
MPSCEVMAGILLPAGLEKESARNFVLPARYSMPLNFPFSGSSRMFASRWRECSVVIS